MVPAAYLLGADQKTYDGMKSGPISDAEIEFVRHPGRRAQHEINQGKRRVAALRLSQAKAKLEAEKTKGKRRKICDLAKQAAANYRKNPGAYHYLAGGKANLTYLKPTPRDWRSDCSQFVAAVYNDAGVGSPSAPLAHLWSSTWSMVKSPHARVVSRAQRKPGDLGMYGSRTAPHHVELYIGEPGCEFIGHGSQPIDSLTPGQPDYYLTYDFLN
jgi:cell wall-associated NlpC family hydrolase